MSLISWRHTFSIYGFRISSKFVQWLIRYIANKQHAHKHRQIIILWPQNKKLQVLEMVHIYIWLCIVWNPPGVCYAVGVTSGYAEPNRSADLWPHRLHIPGRLMNDRWADSVQGTFGLIDSLAPEGSIICHPPGDVSVQPATAVLPQLWIIGHVRRPQTTLSTPVLLPNAHRDFLLRISLLHTHVCAHTHPCMCVYTVCIHTSMLLWTVMSCLIVAGNSVSADTFVEASVWLTKHTSAPTTTLSVDLYAVLFHFKNRVEEWENVCFLSAPRKKGSKQ